MSDSPIQQLLDAIDSREVDAVMELVSPEASVLTADGRRAHGAQSVRKLLGDFLAGLRSTGHQIIAEWHVGEDLWIAEVQASYELRDWLQLTAVPRAFFLRWSADGIAELRVYGAHEHPLDDHPTGEEGLWVGGRWIPPL